MDFFYQPDRKIFTITDEIVNVIKNLKCVPNSGDWYENQPRWTLKDNDIPKNISFHDVGRAMQFIAATSNIEGDIPKHFRILLRQCYIDHYLPGNSADGSEVIVLAGKRPFGNSHVEGDVRWALVSSGFYGNKTHEDFYDNDDYTIEEKELQKFIDFLVNDFFKNFEMKYYSFKFKDRLEQSVRNYEYWDDKLDYTHSILSNWEVDLSELREKKINKVLND